MLWRRDRDSNPGDGFPPTHFPGVRLRPLGHLSVPALFDRSLPDLQDQIAWKSVVEVHVNPTVLFALLFDLTKPDSTDLRRSGNMGSATGLQVDLL